MPDPLTAVRGPRAARHAGAAPGPDQQHGDGRDRDRGDVADRGHVEAGEAGEDPAGEDQHRQVDAAAARAGQEPNASATTIADTTT